MASSFAERLAADGGRLEGGRPDVRATSRGELVQLTGRERELSMHFVYEQYLKGDPRPDATAPV